MKNAKILVCLIALLGVLAACSDDSDSDTDVDNTGGEQSDGCPDGTSKAASRNGDECRPDCRLPGYECGGGGDIFCEQGSNEWECVVRHDECHYACVGGASCQDGVVQRYGNGSQECNGRPPEGTCDIGEPYECELGCRHDITQLSEEEIESEDGRELCAEFAPCPDGSPRSADGQCPPCHIDCFGGAVCVNGVVQRLAYAARECGEVPDDVACHIGTPYECEQGCREDVTRFSEEEIESEDGRELCAEFAQEL